jgi:hypothetical protein
MVLYSTGAAFSRGKPVAHVERLPPNGPDTDYVTVVSWTVPDGKTGMLKEVSMITTNYANTLFRLTIAGEKQFEDLLIPAPLTLPFPDNDLAAGSVVLLECRRTAAGITVHGSITGKEF